MRIFSPYPRTRPPKVVLFDFDGTLSTLRRGWERVMEPMMLQMISGGAADEELIREVREFIDRSTGIQTIHQMKWLAAKVQAYGKNPGLPEDPWWYKARYNERLMEPVNLRIAAIRSGEKRPEDFLVGGGGRFLEELKRRGVTICVASGTDHPDVVREAGVLGLADYFDRIAGAPAGRESCSKEAVLRGLFEENGLSGQDIVVVGDGKVEIALGKEMGAATLGVASNEEKLYGYNEVKNERLLRAGAHAVVGDFSEPEEILSWLALSH